MDRLAAEAAGRGETMAVDLFSVSDERVPAASWLQSRGMLRRMQAVWCIAWSPRLLVTYLHDPLFEGCAFSIVWVTCTWHAIVILLWSIVLLGIGAVCGLLTQGLTGWLRGATYWGIIGIGRWPLYLVMSAAIAWLWSSRRSDPRESSGWILMWVIVFTWSVPVELLTQYVVPVFSLLQMDSTTRIVVMSLRHVLFAIFVFLGVRSASGSRVSLPIALGLLTFVCGYAFDWLLWAKVTARCALALTLG